MKSYLTAQQTAELGARLRARFEALREEIRQDLLKSDDDRTAGLADRVRDLEDESLAALIVDLDLADTDRDLEELQDVEAALARLREGAYGSCMRCGEPIPYDRLVAFPTAKRCTTCQVLQERTFAAKGVPTL
jgi:RNA polymerase-binding transcription factor DksA